MVGHTLSDNAARELLATCHGDTPAWMERVLNGEGSREDWVEAQRALDRRFEAYDTGDRPSSPPAALSSAVVEVSVTLTLWDAL